MAAWNGRWRLTSIENGEAYVDAIHSPEAYKAQLRQLIGEVQKNPDAYIEELFVDGAASNYRRIVYILGEKNRDTGLLSFNTEYEHLHADGRVVKTTAVLESENKIVITEKGEEHTAVITLQLDGDHVVVTDSAAGVTATHKFTRVN